MKHTIAIAENRDMTSLQQPAIFLDRDGVVIKEKHYLSNPNNVQLEQGIVDFLVSMKNCCYLIIIVTNQSAISRGLLDWETYESVTNRMLSFFPSSNLVDAIYANGYIDNSNNDWRKPLPGMILQAAQEFNIDLKSSILIGDKVSDLIAGARAGIKDLIHLRTGHGSAETAYINLESHHRETPCKGTVNADLQDFTVSCYKDIPSLHSYII